MNKYLYNNFNIIMKYLLNTVTNSNYNFSLLFH